MNIELNNELIERCNNLSMYNRGTHIKESAESDYKKFIEAFSSRTLNPQQLEIVKNRTEQFKELITNIYNEYLSISANFVPVNVAGPAKYNSAPRRFRICMFDFATREWVISPTIATFRFSKPPNSS